MILAEELKDTVLSAALSGKLTKQLSTDTLAENSLRKIDEFFKRQYDKKKLSPPRKVKETKNPKLTDIPDSWCWIQLFRIINIKSGDGLTSKGMRGGDIPVFGGNGITGYHTQFNVDKPTIVIGRVGAKCGSVHITENKAWVTDNAFIVTFPDEYINTSFLRLLLISLKLGTRAKATAQPVISGLSIYPTFAPLPPIEEQQRIVDRVDELMEQINEYAKIEQQLISLKNSFPGDLRSAILQAAMQGKLTEQLDTDSSVDELIVKKNESEPTKRRGKKSAQMDIETFDIPSSWRWTKLSECGTTNIGLTYSPEEVTTAKEGTVVLRSSNIQNGKMDYTDIVKVNMQVPENKKCHIGDILICARNGSKRLVGKTAIIDREGDAFGAFMAIYRGACNPYIYYVLNSPHFRKSVLGGAETTTINQITQDMVENYMFPLPPKEEQERIVKCLETLLPLCESVTEE